MPILPTSIYIHFQTERPETLKFSASRQLDGKVVSIAPDLPPNVIQTLVGSRGNGVPLNSWSASWLDDEL